MGEEEPCKAVIGSQDNFWLYSSINGYDLTRPPNPDAGPVYPHVRLKTTTDSVTIDPAKSALVIVDMQNFFLSPSLGRPKDSKGIKAAEALLKHAIPGCRHAGIRVIWLNWGLTEHDVDTTPPSARRAFGFATIPHDVPFEGQNKSEGAIGAQNADVNAKQSGWKSSFTKDSKYRRGLGSEVGPVELDGGKTVDGGRLLMRDQWNTALYPPLEEARQEGLNGKYNREDVWIHKNSLSGLYGGETPCTEYLKSQGIRTLFFAGVNTDQCVGGSLQDAFTKGYDCLFLRDGAATTSPEYGQQCVEFNAEKVYGFVLSCKDLADGCMSIHHS